LETWAKDASVTAWCIGLGGIVLDCSTWVFVDFKPKTPYPPLPRFSLYTASQMSLPLVLQSVLQEHTLRSRCWIGQKKQAVPCIKTANVVSAKQAYARVTFPIVLDFSNWCQIYRELVFAIDTYQGVHCVLVVGQDCTCACSNCFTGQI